MDSQKIAARIASVMESYEIESDYDVENGSVGIRIPLKEINATCGIIIYLREDLDILLAYGSVGPSELFGNENPEAMSELVHRINFELNYGNFILDMSSGDVLYKTILIVEDVFPSDAMLEEMIWQIGGKFISFGPALFKVSRGELSPGEAMEQIEAETEATDEQEEDTPEPSSAQVTRYSFGNGISVDAYFFNGRFGGFTHPDQYDEEYIEEDIEEDEEEDEEVELSWQISVMGEWLQGREREEYTGRTFAFLSFDPYSEEQFESLAEEDSIVKLLQTMGLETRGHGNPNPNSWYGYRELPKYIKKELDQKIIAFMLYLQGHFDCVTEKAACEEDCYLGNLTEVMPDAEFIIGWSALPPFQDEAYAIVAL